MTVPGSARCWTATRSAGAETVTPLDRLFSALWVAFIDDRGFDVLEPENLLERSDLTHWRTATQADIEADDSAKLEEGDQVLALTEEGRELVAAVLAADRRAGEAK